jgi:hypothetical protein
MQIILTPEESEEYFFTAMCNGLGYCFSSYDLELSYEETEFQQAKAKYKQDNPNEKPCIEDIYMQILRNGHSLTVTDGNDNKVYKITLSLVHERVSNCPTATILDMENEEDDGCTADVILQTVILGKVVYG